MADPKYADLPGIAYDQADVYESTDLPCEELPMYSEDETDSVERLYINPTAAFNKFKGKHLIAKGVDFSDRISRKPRIGYTEVYGEWVLPHEGGQETPDERFARLKEEFQELLDEYSQLKEEANDAAEQKNMVEIISQVKTMEKQLNSLKLNETLGTDLVAALRDPQGASLKVLLTQIEQFKKTCSSDQSKGSDEKKEEESPEAGVLKYQMMYLPEKARLQEVQRIAHLEQRLARLENVLGTGNDQLAKFTQSLKTQGVVEAVQQLGAKASLLDSTQIETMESRIATLAHRMDSLAQKKSAMQQDSEREQKIGEMYEIMKKIESSSDVLPQTINRMLTLSAVHQQAAEFGKSLVQLDELQSQITNSLDSNTSLLKDVKNSFAANMESIRENLAALSERVKKLDAK